jgi:hypothetical protein
VPVTWSRRLERRHIQGQAYVLAVLTPIRAGRDRALAAHLRQLPTGAGDPIARLGTVHFARWVIVDRFPFEGPARRRRQPSLQHLLFTTVFDGPLDGFLRALCDRIPEHVDTIWGDCVGFPGPAATNPDAFAGWVRDQALETGLFFAPYGEHTAAQVRDGLRIRDRLGKFAAAMQDAGPAELRAAFERTFRA